MCLQDKVQAFVAWMKQDAALADCDIFIAYPYLKKPTQLKRPAIAVSLSGAQWESIALGQDCYASSYAFEAAVFVAQELGIAQLQRVVEDVVTIGGAWLPASVSVSPVSVRDSIDCFYVKCTFTFKCDERG